MQDNWWRVLCTMCVMDHYQGIAWCDDTSITARDALDRAKQDHCIDGDHDRFLVVGKALMGQIPPDQRAY
jgi:hypothetical protein